MSDRTAQLHRWLAAHFDDHELRIEPASADASFRQYFRVFENGATHIVMDAPPGHEDCRPFLDIDNRLRDSGLNAPLILRADTDQGFVLMSDLGTRVYLDELNDQSADQLYGDAIGALIAMQGNTLTTGLPDYDRDLLMSEMRLFQDWLLGTHLQLQLTDAERQQIESVFNQLVINALEQPQVFVHRDYHARNLMRTEAANPGILDFQDAVIGPVTYDLVSLLRDCYIKWPATRIEQWTNDYLSRAAAADIPGHADDTRFRRWFDLMGIQRHLKAAGIFARLFHRDGKSGYLKDIPRTLQYVVEVGAEYPELAEFGAFIGYTVLPAIHATGEHP